MSSLCNTAGLIIVSVRDQVLQGPKGIVHYQANGIFRLLHVLKRGALRGSTYKNFTRIFVNVRTSRLAGRNVTIAFTGTMAIIG